MFATQSRLSNHLEVGHRLAQRSPSLTQDQRLAWLGELLTGHSESLPYRVAGTLLLLYAQPLVKVAALPTDAVTTTEHGLTRRRALGPLRRGPALTRKHRHADTRKTTHLTGSSAHNPSRRPR